MLFLDKWQILTAQISLLWPRTPLKNRLAYMGPSGHWGPPRGPIRAVGPEDLRLWQSRSLSNIQQKAPLLEAFDILNVLFEGPNCLASNY